MLSGMTRLCSSLVTGQTEDHQSQGLHAYSILGLTVCWCCQRVAFKHRDNKASQVHKHVKTRLFKTLFYYIGACNTDLEWMMSLGFSFRVTNLSLIYITFCPRPFTVIFSTFLWHSPAWFLSSWPSHNRFSSLFSREVLLALSSGGELKQKFSS